MASILHSGTDIGVSDAGSKVFEAGNKVYYKVAGLGAIITYGKDLLGNDFGSSNFISNGKNLVGNVSVEAGSTGGSMAQMCSLFMTVPMREKTI
jgi:hypothetical protein